MAEINEESLKNMESLLAQSALGIHVLFDNPSIARALRDAHDLSDFFDFDKMKKVQDVMTQLIGKPGLYEKQAYISGLDEETHALLVRTYFHLVEGKARSSSDALH